jgi:hypothetical protein
MILRDIQAGKAAGMPTIAAAWGYCGHTEPQSWLADIIGSATTRFSDFDHTHLNFSQCPYYEVTMAALLLGATWFRQGLQSSAGHTEGWSPRKSNRKCLNANDPNYALQARSVIP